MSNEVAFRRTGGPNWVRVWVGLWALWATFVLLGTLLNYQFELSRGKPISWSQSIRINVAEYGIWALVLTPLILLACANLRLSRKNLHYFVPGHLMGMGGVVFIDVLVKTLLRGTVYPGVLSPPFTIVFREYLFHETEPDLQIYLVVAVMAYVVVYYVDLGTQEKHAAELHNSLMRAELQVLKMQLQPHFLFNTLHSVASLIPANPRAAQKMICSLGDLLRMSLAAEDLSDVTLARELEFLQTYLDIQKVRFQDRLIIHIVVSGEDVLAAKVPYFILQPLVENSIKHGIAKKPGPGKVSISARKDLGDLCITISNNSLAHDDSSHEDAEQHRIGIGLENSRSRLRLLYGNQGRITTRESEGSFEVVVIFPFQSSPTVARQAHLISAADSVLNAGR